MLVNLPIEVLNVVVFAQMFFFGLQQLCKRVRGSQQAKRVVLKVVLGASVGDVVFICLVNLVIFQPIRRHVSSLLVRVEQLSCQDRPRVQDALLTERGKKALHLAPDHILVLIRHSNEVDCVELRQGHNDDRVIVLHVGEAALVFIVLNQAAATAGSVVRDFLPEESPADERFDLYNVRTRFLLDRERSHNFILLICQLDCPFIEIGCHVDEPLVGVHSCLEFEIAVCHDQLAVAVEDANLVSADLKVEVLQISEVFVRCVEILKHVVLDLLFLFRG